MDVDRLAVDRPAVGEQLHAVHQRDDAVGLVADQSGQLLIALVDGLLEKLCGTANSGERVLHLMRQHGRHGGHRSRRVAMAELAVEAAGDGDLPDRQGKLMRRIAHRRHAGGHQMHADARSFQGQAVFRHAGALCKRLTDQREDRTVGRQPLGQRMADQHGFARRQKALGVQIDEADDAVGIQYQHRLGQRIENLQRICAGHSAAPIPLSPHRHAATARSCPENSRSIRTKTVSGSAVRLTATRNRAASRSPPAYQPRCLRAIRTPLPTP